MAVAGCKAFRKLMRRYPGFRLEGCGRSHMQIVGPDGRVVRHRNGLPFTISNSPRNEDKAAREVMRQLAALGITPTT